MSALDRVRQFGREVVRWNPPAAEVEVSRAYNPEWQGLVDAYLRYQGGVYQPGYSTTYAGQKAEPVLDTFVGYVQGAYKTNGVVFSVSMARAMLFTDARLRWRRYGQTGGGNDLFGNRDLNLLEHPWPGGSTQQLLMRAEQDVTAAGTFFVAREDDGPRPRLRRLRPDWCEFILTAPPDEAIQSDVVGIKYTVGGPRSGGESKLYLVNPGPEVRNLDGYAMAWSPIPDPDAQFRGMSWLTPVIEEMRSDGAATAHKLKFFENAATPNLAVSLKETVTLEQFKQFVREMNEASVGVENAYKNLYLGGGADVTIIGTDMRQIDFSATQGHGETRVCAAGRVPPIIVGLSEGLSAATYSNYAQARRAFGDSWARPQWKSFAAAIEPLVGVPLNAAGERDAELVADVRDVAFLREDAKDIAEVLSTTMATINAALAAGWTPDTARDAVLNEDLSQLVHSGLMSVQLQPPMTAEDAAAETEPVVEEADPTEETATQASTIMGLTAGPWDPESIKTAVLADDLSKLIYVQPEPDPALEDPALVEGAPDPELERRHRAGGYVRDGEGQFAAVPGAPAADLGPVADPLKLSSRIWLGPGETFGGSARVNDATGDNTLVLAKVIGPEGLKIRVGEVGPEDTRRWRAADRGRTVELDAAGAAELQLTVRAAVALGKKDITEHRAKLRAGEDPPPEATLAAGTIPGRWGDIQWTLTREEGPEYADLGPGGEWNLAISPVSSGSNIPYDPFHVSTPAAAGKLDKALATMIGDPA